MNKFIVKPNHELKKLIKMNSNYIEKIVKLNDSSLIIRICEDSPGLRLADLLKSQDINQFDDLIKHSEYSLRKINGLGFHSIRSIKKYLEEVGLSLRDENAEEINEQKELKRIKSQKLKDKYSKNKEKIKKERKQKREENKLKRAAFEEQCRIQAKKNKKLAAEIKAENERIEAERRANPIMFANG